MTRLLFTELWQKIAEAARAGGIDMISLAVGDPVEPTPQERLVEVFDKSQVLFEITYDVAELIGLWRSGETYFSCLGQSRRIRAPQADEPPS